jgi:hypothetical protein
MKRTSFRLCVACLLAAVSVAGCNTANPRSRVRGPVQAASPQPPTVVVQVPVTPQPEMILSAPIPAKDEPTAEAKPDDRVWKTSSSTAVAPPPPPAEPIKSAHAPPPAPTGVATPVPATRTGIVRGEKPREHRSDVDITAHPCFGHASDYRWVSGQVMYSRVAKSWRLRYASVDEIDPYGGSVTLVDDGQLRDLKDGGYYRIHGHLENPEEKVSSPPYHVQSIEPIDPK